MPQRAFNFFAEIGGKIKIKESFVVNIFAENGKNIKNAIRDLKILKNYVIMN